jgi:hypothetical protein
VDFVIYVTLAKVRGLQQLEASWTDTVRVQPGELTSDVIGRYIKSVWQVQPEFTDAAVRHLALLPAVLVPVTS